MKGHKAGHHGHGHEHHEHHDGHKDGHHKEVHLHMAHGGRRKKRATGGMNDAAEDLAHRNMEYTKDSNVNREAEERRRGGRAKRKHGGMVHHEKMEHMKHAKHIGKVHGEHAKEHAGRKPRKSGGRTGSDSHPYSSAHRGDIPHGREEQTEFN